MESVFLRPGAGGLTLCSLVGWSFLPLPLTLGARFGDVFRRAWEVAIHFVPLGILSVADMRVKLAEAGRILTEGSFW